MNTALQIRQEAYKRLMHTKLLTVDYVDALGGLRRLDNLSPLVPLKLFLESRTAWIRNLVKSASVICSADQATLDVTTDRAGSAAPILEQFVHTLQYTYMHAASIFLAPVPGGTPPVHGNTSVVVVTSCDMWLQDSARKVAVCLTEVWDSPGAWGCCLPPCKPSVLLSQTHALSCNPGLRSAPSGARGGLHRAGVGRAARQGARSHP